MLGRIIPVLHSYSHLFPPRPWPPIGRTITAEKRLMRGIVSGDASPGSHSRGLFGVGSLAHKIPDPHHLGRDASPIETVQPSSAPSQQYPSAWFLSATSGWHLALYFSSSWLDFWIILYRLVEVRRRNRFCQALGFTFVTKRNAEVQWSQWPYDAFLYNLQLLFWQDYRKESPSLCFISALDEMHGKEKQLATDPDCSVVLERMIYSMDDFVWLIALTLHELLEISKFVNWLLIPIFGRYETLVRHRFASHVCQTLFTVSKDTISREVGF